MLLRVVPLAEGLNFHYIYGSLKGKIGSKNKKFYYKINKKESLMPTLKANPTLSDIQQYVIDLEKAFRDKEALNHTREWK